MTCYVQDTRFTPIVDYQKWAERLRNLSLKMKAKKEITAAEALTIQRIEHTLGLIDGQ